MLIYFSFKFYLDFITTSSKKKKKNQDGRTALHEVCRSPKNKEEVLARIAKRLIQSGSDVNLTSASQEDLNALMYAAYHNHVGVANVLIENNCDINTTDYVI